MYGSLMRQLKFAIGRHVKGPLMYVFPDPASDVKNLFHKLPRHGKPLGRLRKAIKEGKIKKGGFRPENHPELFN